MQSICNSICEKCLCCCSREERKRGIIYEDVKNEIKELDLIMFKSSECFGDVILVAESLSQGITAKWTHVGMVVSTKVMDIPLAKPNELYLYESTSSSEIYGVQLRPLEEVVEEYDKDPDARVGWCELIDNPIHNNIKKVRDTMNEIYNEFKDKSYDDSICNLGASVCCCRCSKIRHCCDKETDKVFCSEFVTIIYQRLGIVDKNIDPEMVSPEEYVNMSKSNLNKCPVYIPPIFVTMNR